MALNRLILLLSVIWSVSGQDLENVLVSLQSTLDLMNTSVPLRGHPFPQVSGPKTLESRIVIIGAGPAGIHMAYKLQNLGYKNVVLLEKSHRVGGKCWTVRYRGVPQEIGAAYILEDNPELKQLVKEFHAGPLLSVTGNSVWINPKLDVSSDVYFVTEAARFTNGSSTTVFLKILSAIRRYIKIHRNLFGDYPGQLMQRPDSSVLQLVHGTLLDFLSRNNLDILEGVFTVVFTMKGYGYINETAALYGLIWVTPASLINVLQGYFGQDMGVSILEKGFSSLWESIIRQRNITVKFRQNITHIIRTPNQVHIIQNNPDSMSPAKIETYDFLIISPGMNEMLSILDTTSTERRIFSQLTPSFLTVSLLDTNFGRRGSYPSSIFMFHANSRKDHTVWIQRDSFALINGIKGDNFTSGLIAGGDDGKYYQTIVTVQHSKSYPSAAVVNTNLRTFAAQFNVTKGKALLRHTWNYFPRFPNDMMSSGVLWDIFAMQGEKNTWYIGSSVCYESLESVLDYNSLLLQHFNSDTKTKI